MIKPLEILTDNLITTKHCSLSFERQEALHTIIITFTSPQQADTLIIKNANASEASVYKTDGGEEVLIKTISANSEEDLIIRFGAIHSSVIFKIVLSGPVLNNTEAFCLCRNLITLDNVLTSLKRNDFKREGYHYLANGSLVKWSEMLKFGCVLSLKNLDKPTKNLLFKILKENSFLTFIFYGEFDTNSIYQLAPQTMPEEFLDRKTALYEADLYLLEK